MNLPLDKTSYDTTRELTFIRGLAGGGFKAVVNDGLLNKHNPRAALTKYLATCEKRVNWDGVDKEKCIQYAMTMLGAME